MIRLIAVLIFVVALGAPGGPRVAAQVSGETSEPAAAGQEQQGQPAQQPQQAQPAQPPQQAQPSPPAQSRDNWVVVCDPPTEGAEKRCTLVQNLAVRSGETQQRLLTVLIQKQPGAENMMLLLGLPHGLFLPAGAQIRIDDGEPTGIVIQTSDAAGSYAATALTPELVDALRRGQVLNVSMTSANQQSINVPVTLVGFTKGFAQLTESLR